jgi:hypothetical protein
LNLRVNLESTCEVFDAFEDIDKGIIAFPHGFGRLANPYINIGQTEWSRVTLTERRTPIPEKITFAGGNAWRLVRSLWQWNMELVWTYKTDTVVEGCVGRDSVQPIDNRLEPLDKLRIAIPEFIKCL